MSVISRLVFAPLALMNRVSLTIWTLRVNRKVNRVLPEGCDSNDLGYALAPYLIKRFGVDGVLSSVAYHQHEPEVPTSVLETDVGIMRWMFAHQAVMGVRLTNLHGCIHVEHIDPSGS